MQLHNEIMNLPARQLQEMAAINERNPILIYRVGHRDARDAAAELSLKYQMYIEKLEALAGELQDSLISGIVDLPGIRKECGL